MGYEDVFSSSMSEPGYHIHELPTHVALIMFLLESYLGLVFSPLLPEITVNTVTVDPDSLSFIPQNPDVELKDIMTVCKEDALKEASESKELYQTAEENLQSAIEALLSPILKNAGYTMQWDI